MNIKEYINTLKLPYRGNCISCGNKNTFVASVINTEIVYHCFHSSCKLKGKLNDYISINRIKQWNFNLPSICTDRLDKSDRDGKFSVPDYFIGALQNSECYRFLHRNNLFKYYEHNVDRIKYDPKQHRCVFLLKDTDNEFYGATGRALGGEWPRWFIYERINGCPFKPTIRNETKSCLIVEDCVSAIHSNDICSSYSLLGTNLPINISIHFNMFSNLFIALDDDATGKALKLQKELSFYKPTKIIPLRKDLKYFNDFELKELKETYNL